MSISQKRMGLNWLICSVAMVMLQALLANAAVADWVLDNERSSLSFTTTKNGKVTEAHRFTGLSGAIDKDGIAEVDIDLLTVATGIDIRDERMREFLFETDQFAKASITASVAEVLKSVKSKSKVVEVDAELALHGKTMPITLEMLVTHSKNQWIVSSIKPLLINASDYQLDGGVEKLRQVAELSSISATVPVHFVLTFAKN